MKNRTSQSIETTDFTDYTDYTDYTKTIHKMLNVEYKMMNDEQDESPETRIT
jgi:hypothetical protein